ncbi:MAG: hypothetical protein M3336_13525 [Chloroflexota bacterium]|nr:hypothetical protein [Chloroflexota bacterium]
MTSAPYDKPIRQTFYVADLKCYLCGAVSGSIESQQALAPDRRPEPVLLRRPGQTNGAPVPDWRRLRCDRCGGPLYLDERNVITRRVDEYNWLDERPRRGRPPKRLLEERRREREFLDQQAAA